MDLPLIVLSKISLVKSIWETINPYWLSFIASIPVGAGIVISQTLLNKTILRRFNKEDKRLEKIEERITKLENKK